MCCFLSRDWVIRNQSAIISNNQSAIIPLYCLDYHCLLCLPMTDFATVEPAYLLLATIKNLQLCQREIANDEFQGKRIIISSIESAAI